MVITTLSYMTSQKPLLGPRVVLGLMSKDELLEKDRHLKTVKL